MSVKPVRSSKESVPATDNETEFDSTLDVLERARNGDGSAARVLIERTVGSSQAVGTRTAAVLRAGGREHRRRRAGCRAPRPGSCRPLRAPLGRRHAEYLRESVRNRIRDEVRRVTRRGVGEELPDSLHDNSYSPLEELILKERSERYLAALRTLKPNDRMAIIFRLEQQLSLEEIAAKLGKSSPDAARMAVTRAVKRLGEAIGLSGPITPSGASDAGDRGGSGRARTGS